MLFTVRVIVRPEKKADDIVQMTEDVVNKAVETNDFIPNVNISKESALTFQLMVIEAGDFGKIMEPHCCVLLFTMS